LKPDRLAGLVLAGGRSTRFGSDKAAALLDGRALIQWVVSALDGVCSEIVIAAAPNQRLPPLEARSPLRVVRDTEVGLGPLAGLATGLAAITAPICFAASCDAPLLRGAIVELLYSKLLGHDIACAEVDGRLQPLVAVFRPATCLPAFRQAIERQELKLTAAFANLDLVVVGESDLRMADRALESFVNINRPQDLEIVKAMVEARQEAKGGTG
jgi:molybdenum cofactor guanylyltransferase